MILIPTTLLGLCAAAVAAPIGFGTSIIRTAESFQEPSDVPMLDRIAPDYDFSVHSAPGSLFDIDPRETAPGRDIATFEDYQPAPEPAPGVMLMAGLAFFGIARILRIAPLLLRRIIGQHGGQHGGQRRRRKVKVELRMMA